MVAVPISTTRKETAFFAQKLPACAEGAMMWECGLCQTPSV